ncbi:MULTISPECIES: pilus (MSHA type) biogenesis protein MshL [unclassified Uliginosibacterium]|uniref:pilus (MSHA type) biogenesis protein MshL n=1 Tax=unclassified Uliginosibacterium TaxID=2621521 RepID=UPI000C7BF142|nr:MULTISPECIES: pilus (MSHA type) biogenesis protein MshL [unclassified Uliginosibacterium]MDO6384903.1 pilus (MSHA type) biogenesis protein MshL [Uliginosibacterium sp. 31-12]PLK48599.1 pilus (MSHA type) biogenesis protein MshL [Uliginosibacterium sp. TH139]
MKTLSSLVLVLLLSACVAQQAARKPADTIRAELAAAAAQPPSAPQLAPGQQSAFYPSLRLDMPEATARVMEPRFDLVVSDAPVRQVFLSMVADTRYSMLLPNDLDGKVTVSLKDVSVREALDALRELYGYEYRIDGSRIFIQGRSLQTRIMKVNYLNAVRKGTSDIRVISGSVSDSASSSGSTTAGTSGTSSNTSTNFVTSKITTTAQSDFWGELQEAVKSIIGTAEGRSVVVSPQSGVLVVRALPGEIAQVEAFLAASQLTLERQVIIEAKIMEVVLSDSFQAGINWAAFGGSRISAGQLTPGSSISQGGAISTTPIGTSGVGNISNSSDAVGAMFGMILRSSNFTAVINLLEEQGRVHVLSSPRVAALNNQKAVLKVGTDNFFVTNISSTASTTSNGNPTSTPNLTLQPFFSGVALDVTPQIDGEDRITLHIHPMVSKVTAVTQEINLGTLGKFSLPLASSQVSEMDSVVRIRDGQMVALGGLIREGAANTDQGIPGASNLPIVGNLFKNQSIESERRELVILLRPTVVQNPGNWSDDIRQSNARVGRLLDERGNPSGGPQ